MGGDRFASGDGNDKGLWWWLIMKRRDQSNLFSSIRHSQILSKFGSQKFSFCAVGEGLDP